MTDITAAKEFVAQYENQIKAAEGEDVPDSSRQGVVKALVEKTVELKGALEAPKDSGAHQSYWKSDHQWLIPAEVESSHLLLSYLLSSTFDPSATEFQNLSRSVIDSIESGAEASSSRAGKLDTASRM